MKPGYATVEMTIVCPPPVWHIELMIAGLWFFPVGAFVMRRHLAGATGHLLAAKGILVALAWMTGPFAVMSAAMTILPAAIETVQTLVDLARVAW